MNNMRDALVKAGLVTKEQVTNSLEKQLQEKQEASRVAEQKARQDYQQKRENQINRDRLTAAMLLLPVVEELIKNTPRVYKQLFCMKCHSEGSTRLDVVAAHNEMLDQQKNFLFMIDADEKKKFTQALIDKVGVVVDTLEISVNGEVKKVYLCTQCQQNLGVQVGG